MWGDRPVHLVDLFFFLLSTKPPISIVLWVLYLPARLVALCIFECRDGGVSDKALLVLSHSLSLVTLLSKNHECLSATEWGSLLKIKWKSEQLSVIIITKWTHWQSALLQDTNLSWFLGSYCTCIDSDLVMEGLDPLRKDPRPAWGFVKYKSFGLHYFWHQMWAFARDEDSWEFHSDWIVTQRRMGNGS